MRWFQQFGETDENTFVNIHTRYMQFLQDSVICLMPLSKLTILSSQLLPQIRFSFRYCLPTVYSATFVAGQIKLSQSYPNKRSIENLLPSENYPLLKMGWQCPKLFSCSRIENIRAEYGRPIHWPLYVLGRIHKEANVLVQVFGTNSLILPLSDSVLFLCLTSNPNKIDLNNTIQEKNGISLSPLCFIPS